MTASIESSLPTQPFFTPAEIADILRVHRRTVTNWIKDPDHPLVGVKMSNTLWRVPRENLIKYLELKYGTQSP